MITIRGLYRVFINVDTSFCSQAAKICKISLKTLIEKVATSRFIVIDLSMPTTLYRNV